MGEPAAPRRRPVIWAIVTVLLAAALIGMLWVPFYARATPKLGAFPFFYWYQLIWVPIVAILSGLAYLLSRSARPGETAGTRPDPAPAPGPSGPGTGDDSKDAR